MTDKRHGQLSSATVETTAGLTAGILSTLIVHPLDILKTRLQVTHGRPHPLLGSSLRTFTAIIRTEGPRSLYRGLTPNLLGNSTSWALYFLWYAQAQDLIRSYRYPHDSSSENTTHPLSTTDYLLASAASGTLTALLTNPIWVVKTRMLSTPSAASNAYPSMLHGLRSIYTTEGIRGYFAGLTPALFGVSHGALYFGVYERLKAWRRDREGKKGEAGAAPTNLDTIFMSSVAKVVAGTATYPHQLVRTRMQNYGAASSSSSSSNASTSTTTSNSASNSSKTNPSIRKGLMATVRSIWKEEGAMAFYKGLGPNLVRVVPSTCVTFLVYENVRVGLPAVWGGDDEGRDEARVEGV